MHIFPVGQKLRHHICVFLYCVALKQINYSECEYEGGSITVQKGSKDEYS